MKASWQWINDYITLNADPEDVARRLTMGGLEVKLVEKHPHGDVIFDVEITSNRPDWLSHIGIAREISALYGKRIIPPSCAIPMRRVHAQDVTIHIQDARLCPFYSAVLIALSDGPLGRTPDFIQRRLNAVGLRLVNLPVDISNYVLLEYGQPLHVFDFHKIQEAVVVRRARAGEEFRAINGTQYTLTADDCVIADRRSVLALAGVMGGLESEVTADTRMLLLESAFFLPSAIRKTSQRHQLMSDSSYRFERRVDPAGVVMASDRFVHLLTASTAVRSVSRRISCGRLPLKKHSLSFSTTYVADVLGARIAPSRIKTILQHLGFSPVCRSKNLIRITIPSFRADVTRPIDAVEEIARIYGYDAIKETIPRIRLNRAPDNKELLLENRLRDISLRFGLDEVITFSLVNPERCAHVGIDCSHAVRLINPSNKQLSMMRVSLLSGFMEVVQSNAHTGAASLSIFELGRIYTGETKTTLPNEEKILAIALTGMAFDNWLDKKRPRNFYDLKGYITAYGEVLGVEKLTYTITDSATMSQSFTIMSGRHPIGYCGTIHPQTLALYDLKEEIYYAQLSLPALLQCMTWTKRFTEYSRYPASERDLALIVDQTTCAGDLEECIRAHGGALVKSIRLFDCYEGKQIPSGKKSLAFAIEYQADDRTLSSGEIEAAHQQIITMMSNKYAAVLRTF